MRIAPAMLALLAGIVLVPIGTPITPVVAADAATAEHCTDWSSTTEPPPTIRVWRKSQGIVEEVDFKTYVIRVAFAEWHVKQRELRRAGATAVKQYAWFRVLHYHGATYNDECYDIRDTTADQIYQSRPLEQIPDKIKRAVNATWDWTMWRGDRFFRTTYRTGHKGVPCAEDAGKRLKARSAKRCAKEGWTAQQILEKYYTATLHTGSDTTPTDPPPDTATPDYCTDWSSTSQPPPTIRVQRVGEGRIDDVDFKAYVMRVAYGSWNSSFPALRKAGAVAAKQYAWYQILNYRGGMANGECYDVKDTPADQVYADYSLDSLPSQVKSATNKTWDWTLWRNDELFSTTFGKGQRQVACAEDAGDELKLRSARKCAKLDGWTTQQILETYYTAALDKG